MKNGHIIKFGLSVFVLAVVGFLSPKAWALDCRPLSFDEKVQQAKNVVVGTVTKVNKGSGERPPTQTKSSYELTLIKVLKDGGLFAKDTKSFVFAANHGWSHFDFKKGQWVMFFFDENLGVRCNEPLVLK